MHWQVECIPPEIILSVEERVSIAVAVAVAFEPFLIVNAAIDDEGSDGFSQTNQSTISTISTTATRSFLRYFCTAASFKPQR